MVTRRRRRRRGRSWITPAAIAFVTAVILSTALHLPVYSALGALANWLATQPVQRPPKPVEVEFGVVGPDSTFAKAPAQSPAKSQKPNAPTPPPENAVTPPEAQLPKEEKKAKEVKVAKAAEQPPVPPPSALQAVKQKSQDPSVAPPDNPKFIAKENSRVQEETRARITNYSQDDPDPQLNSSQSKSETPDQGNAEQQKAGDAKDQEGAETGRIAALAPNTPQPSPSPSGGGPPRPAPEASGGGAQGPKGGAPTPSGQTGPSEAGGDNRLTGDLAVSGGPAEGQGRGGKAAGAGAAVREFFGGGSGAGAINRFKVSWNTFNKTYGESNLQSEYQAREQSRLAHRAELRGSTREKNWKEFRGAIENFVPNVRAGNQTALNAAASPFADYLTAVHIQIHREFADKFLPGLPGGVSPYSDYSLMTKLEIILNRDGTVHRVGVVSSSGLLPFDYGAFSSVMKGQPYPEPPASILSADGRVYFHWGFYRNERQCGTFNAEAFILANPPGSKPSKDPGRTDGPDVGGVVPKGAVPANRVGQGSDQG
jgi:hypothetical protein